MRNLKRASDHTKSSEKSSSGTSPGLLDRMGKRKLDGQYWTGERTAELKRILREDTKAVALIRSKDPDLILEGCGRVASKLNQALYTSGFGGPESSLVATAEDVLVKIEALLAAGEIGKKAGEQKDEKRLFTWDLVQEIF